MKREAVLVIIGATITLGFALTRNAYFMGATVFVATPLFLVALFYYALRVLRELRGRDVL